MLETAVKDKMVKKSKNKIINQEPIKQTQSLQSDELVTKTIKQTVMIRGKMYNIGDEINLTLDQINRFSKQGYV